jgi:hypothetical protein
MPADRTGAGSSPAGDARFTNTHWSVVLAAGGESSQAAAALAELSQAYWYPLYAFARRSGYGPDDAEDLTQEFFRRLVEKKWLTQVDQSKGRFRSFLIASLRQIKITTECPIGTVKDSSTISVVFDSTSNGDPKGIDRGASDLDGDGLTGDEEAKKGTKDDQHDTDGDGKNDKDDNFPTDPQKN